MKTILTTLACLAFALVTASADDKKTTTTTTTYGSGTITEYTPGTTFVLKETAGPVTYKYGDSVTYVTKSGTVLTEEQVKTRIKVGVPARVYYTPAGETKTITKVEVDD
ncbi:hypothetical protein DES53_104298 [Roseimicrobium gellanilyticum]|uniref:DUF5666 domain-containing protein n=1 Tax=Roseimicrobium gellanilyticum TaxID=748857 RepID=A0A366HMU6_9BACT|nr:hypothetical protein [Roseimicrobium gellanilyticum]RBP44477.1 hypothetical protein DES53_104298 [Roseimicrobium gellanilyticum]